MQKTIVTLHRLVSFSCLITLIFKKITLIFGKHDSWRKKFSLTKGLTNYYYGKKVLRIITSVKVTKKSNLNQSLSNICFVLY